MRRIVPLVLTVCLLGLIVSCYGSVLFRNEQFSFRDAAHFYYPLYQRVQQEWAKGHLPLWETEENAGMPLLGNPTAAVLYPGKLIFALAPSYPWGVRAYTIAHSLLAFGGMFLLMRSWRTSLAGSGLSAIAYAFGIPIVYQYCNIIFLVGAAWLPLGIRAADRWLRQGRLWALGELSVVLAMQTLGGDPETAYLLGISTACYALGLVWSRAERPRISSKTWIGIVLSTLVGWFVLTLAAGALFPRFRQIRMPPVELPWTPWLTALLPTAWGLVVFLCLARWLGGRGRGRVFWAVAGALGVWLSTAVEPMTRMILSKLDFPLNDITHWLQWIGPVRPLGAVVASLSALRLWMLRERVAAPARALGGLLGAGALAAILTSAQLLPMLEFTRLTSRKVDAGPHDVFPFSIEPFRLIELAFANFYGSPVGDNGLWLPMVPPTHRLEVWTPSLYVGGLTIVLAIGAWGLRNASAERVWLSLIAVLSALGAMGKYAGPLWLSRAYLGAESWLGPLDPTESPSIRFDGYLKDGDGSPYGLMALLLPGFSEFRYPAKLFTFTCLALSGLSGLGWDRVTGSVGRSRWRAARTASALVALGLVGLLVMVSARGPIMAAFQASPTTEQGGLFGPFQPRVAWNSTVFALAYGCVVFALSAVLILMAHRRPRLTSALALVLLSADLAFLDAPEILTVPQSAFETPIKILDLIRAAERQKPTPGGYYRIHRLPYWEKFGWYRTHASDRMRDVMEWERQTLQPKYGLPLGVPYTLAEGTAELYDYLFFFAPFEGIHDRATAEYFTGDPSVKLVTHPRRGFDLWNTRYFLLPYVPHNDERRSYYAFIADSELLAPDFPDSVDEKTKQDWAENQDWMLRRNLDVFPRAWVVHDALIRKPITGLNRADRADLMEEITYKNDPTWSVRDKVVYDPRKYAWVELDDPRELGPYLSRAATKPSEAPRITRYDSENVEIDVELETPGLLVLADVFYPGWRLTIDGKPAPIYRTNRMMRGAALSAGRHHLVYSYKPASVRLGLALSALGLLALSALGVWSRKQPVIDPLSPEKNP